MSIIASRAYQYSSPMKGSAVPTTAIPARALVTPLPTWVGGACRPGKAVPGPEALSRGSTTSMALTMRALSPGLATSMRMSWMKGSGRRRSFSAASLTYRVLRDSRVSDARRRRRCGRMRVQASSRLLASRAPGTAWSGPWERRGRRGCALPCQARRRRGRGRSGAPRRQ